MPRYSLWLLVLAAVLLAITAAVFHVGLQTPVPTTIFLLYAYLLALGFGTHALLSRAIKKRPQAFINTFMATMSIKMLVSLGVLVAAIFADKEQLMPIAISFLTGYFAFMVLEVMNMRAMSMEQTRREREAKAAEAAE